MNANLYTIFIFANFLPIFFQFFEYLNSFSLINRILFAEMVVMITFLAGA